VVKKGVGDMKNGVVPNYHLQKKKKYIDEYFHG
jgi:hypothetical protein